MLKEVSRADEGKAEDLVHSILGNLPVFIEGILVVIQCWLTAPRVQ